MDPKLDEYAAASNFFPAATIRRECIHSLVMNYCPQVAKAGRMCCFF